VPRVSRFTPENRSRVIAALRAGATEAFACAGLNPPLAVRTLANWKTQNPDFLQELRDAKQIPDGNVQVALFRSATGRALARRKPMIDRVTRNPILGPDGQVLYEEEYFQPNVIAMIFWLKNRQPDDWKDRTEIAPSDKPIVVEIVESIAASPPHGE
jgi:hypothetical protein